MNNLFKINGNPDQYEDLDVFHKLAQQFLPYAQRSLGFDKPVGVNLLSDPENVKDPLGKTAYYDPNKMEITLFVDKRHVKDVLRSMAHELVHHTQNCRGEFDEGVETGPGYAQDNEHMRKMEAEAYLKGSGFLLRDWEDSLKKENQVMSESKIQEERSVFAPNHYCVHHGGVYMEGEVKLGKVVSHNWNDNLKKVTKYDMQFEDGTILENVKAEDILVTEASLANEHMHGVSKRDDEDLEEAFPDLTGDGKVTQADILKGRGVKLDEKETQNVLDPAYDGPPMPPAGEMMRKAEEASNLKFMNKMIEHGFSAEQIASILDINIMDIKDQIAGGGLGPADEALFEADDKDDEKKDDDKKDDKKKDDKKKDDDKKGGMVVDDSKAGGAGVGGDKDKLELDLDETWTRGNKDQLLFERLIEKWIK
jgi:hypothetical protein